MSINDSGDIAGFFFSNALDATCGACGFVRDADGTIATISIPNPDPGSKYPLTAQVFAINASGYVTGNYIGFVTTPQGYTEARHGFVTHAKWNPDGVRPSRRIQQ